MSSIVNGSKGFCYIMGSAALGGTEPGEAGLLKIGATTLSPAERAKQLTASTASPLPFFVLYSRPVPDVNAAEAAMHEIFASKRVNEKREFFRVSLLEAAKMLDLLCASYEPFDSGPPVETPYAELFASFEERPDDPYLNETEQAAVRALERKLATAQ